MGSTIRINNVPRSFFGQTILTRLVRYCQHGLLPRAACCLTIPCAPSLPSARSGRERYICLCRARRLDFYSQTPQRSVLQNNLAAILDMAARRGDRVLLMAFATSFPKTTPRSIQRKRLDYSHIYLSAIGTPRPCHGSSGCHSKLYAVWRPSTEFCLWIRRSDGVCRC
jgi:hypothetical protein